MTLVVALFVMLVLSISTAAVVRYTQDNASSANRALDRQGALAYAEQGLAAAAGIVNNAKQTILDQNGNRRTDLDELAGSSLTQEILPDSGSKDARDCSGVGNPGPLAYAGNTPDPWTATSCGHLQITSTLGGVPTAGTWYVVSVGTIAHGGITSRRIVTAQIPITSDSTLQWSRAFQYTYSAGSNTEPSMQICDQMIANNTTITSRMYVHGDLCLDNSAVIDGSAGSDTQLIVLGHVRGKTNNKGVVGATIEVSHVEVGMGCHRGTDAFTVVAYSTPGGAGWNLPCDWENSGVRNTSITPPSTDWIEPPTTDYAYYYDKAMPKEGVWPDHPNVCAAGGSVPWKSKPNGGNGFDNNSVLDNSYAPGGTSLRAGDFFPGTNYDCVTPSGELHWNAATRTWTVNGVLYFDGSVDLSGAGTINVNGFGTIYVSGHLTFSQTKLCMVVSGSSCDSTHWQTQTEPLEMLLWVVKGDGTQVDSPTGTPKVWTEIMQSSYVQGAIFSDKAVEIQNLSYQEGPVVSLTYVIQNHSTVDYFPVIANMPDGTPGDVIVSQVSPHSETTRYGL